MIEIEEKALNDVLAERVGGARVVHITGQGFWALIPHYRNALAKGNAMALSPHFLGEVFWEAEKMLRRCWDTPEIDPTAMAAKY